MDEGDHLGARAALSILAGLRMAAYRWDVRTDTVVWSDGAEEALAFAGGRLPATGRDLQRLFTPAAAARRMTRIPAVRPAHAVGEHRLTLELREDVAGAAGVEAEEVGRWSFDGAGAPVALEGTLRRLDARPASASGAPAGLVARDGLLSHLDMLAAEHVAEQRGSTAFMLVAVNDLSRINANFGFDVGDRVIAAVANRILRRLRGGDVIGHLSGHKFGLVLHNCSESALAHAAERFRAAVESEAVPTLEAEVRASVSIGAVLLPRHARTGESAAQRAEEALAEARAERKGFRIYQPSAEKDLRRRRNLALAEEIVRGLGRDRFVLAYQPIVDARTRTVVSYEALTRLVRDDGTVVSAGPLIATAERLGLVRRLDQRALGLVLDDLVANDGLKLSVNASVESIADPFWLDQLVERVRRHRAIAGRLTVEITETALMRKLDDMLRAGEILRDIGCKVAIDDFGAGHTSFKTLRRMELDCVKIDGSYVRDMRVDPDAGIFVRTLTGLARHFGIRVVAEYVQDEETAAELVEAGVDLLQGKHTGEPRLRVMPQTAAVLADAVPERESDGYPSYAGLIEGPVTVGTAVPLRVTSQVRADRAASARPRAAS